MAKTATFVEQTNMPANGRWIWKDDPNHPTLEYISNNPSAERQDKKRDGRRQKGIHFHDHGARRADRGPTSGYQRGALIGVQKLPLAVSDDHENVTLEDVKKVARNMMGEVDHIPDLFLGILETEQMDHFLYCVLNFFHWFFEKRAQEQKPNPMNIEPSLRELQYYADLCEKLESAQKLMGHAYCVLVLGIGLQGHHHMACGGNRVSSTYKDRSMYETLYTYCTFFIWIAFKRKEYEVVKKELGRMLRSDTFNPSLRVKNAPEESEEGGKTTPKKEEKKLSAAEYRRMHGKRPAIKSIINQRSPALVSILPSPKEEASWLFKRTGAVSPTTLSKIGKEELDEEEVNNATKYMQLDLDELEVGIIGEPLNQFNAITLAPLGADNEEEENEDDDKHTSHRDSVAPSTGHAKTPVSQEGPPASSRAATAISQVTTEAQLSDED